nr:protein GUCD1-like [Physcomitrium patens]|eukprot:XP_024361451.1 protein GUCD1-like [Physcomitrella patens]
MRGRGSFSLARVLVLVNSSTASRRAEFELWVGGLVAYRIQCVHYAVDALDGPQSACSSQSFYSVLKFLGVEGCDLKYLSQLCQTTSIWTVDLAHLLRHFKVDVVFLTVTIGANPSFAVETFYQTNMEEDGERVNMLFAKAPQVGIRVQWRSITGEELSLLILSGGFLAIILVDKRKLSHPWLDEICLADCCGLNTGYTGHYVVICGYDMDSDEFEIQDPASGSGRISLDALDEARRAFGTDEDILLVWYLFFHLTHYSEMRIQTWKWRRVGRAPA